MTTFEYKPIGIVHTPFAEREGMPIQPAGAKALRERLNFLRNITTD